MNYDNYTTKNKFPHKNDFYVYNLYRQGQVIACNLMESVAIIEYGKNFRKDYIIETVFLEEAYNKQKEVYRKEQEDAFARFKQDLFEEYGVINNPKREMLFSIAYERGKSEGMYSIDNWFGELVELIL